MSLLWTRAMAWHDDDRENEPDGAEDFRDKRPYHERRPGLVDHISFVHDVDHDVADRALEKIENHSTSLNAPSIHFGFAGHTDDARSRAGTAEMRTPELWHRAHVAEVPLKGMKASQSWVRPSGVAHNLFHPGMRAPEEDGVEGDPDYDPEWDEDRHRETDEMMHHEYDGKPQPQTDLPRFLRHTDGSYTCLDGHHRVAADLLLGKASIPGRVIHEKQLARSAHKKREDERPSTNVHDSRDYPRGGSAYFPWADFGDAEGAAEGSESSGDSSSGDSGSGGSSGL